MALTGRSISATLALMQILAGVFEMMTKALSEWDRQNARSSYRP